MRDFNQLKIILEEQKVAEGDQQLIKDFLNSLGFQKRQQLMGIFLGFSDKLKLFIDLIKKKKVLAENYDENLAEGILDLEDKEIEDLISKINTD